MQPEEALRQLELRYQLTADAARRYWEAGFDVVVQDNYYGAMLPHMLALLGRFAGPRGGALSLGGRRCRARSVARKKGYGGYEVRPLWDAFHGGKRRASDSGWTPRA